MAKLNRLNDLFFKYLMGNENHKALTLDFINSVAGDDCGRHFKDIIFTNKDEEPEKEGGKLSKLDIKGMLDNETWIDIEVQVHPYNYMNIRSLYYWSKMYSGQLSESDDYQRLKPTIVINLLNYDQLKAETDWHNVYHVRNDKSGKLLTDHLEMHFLEIPKLKLQDLKDLHRAKKSECWGAYFSGKVEQEELEGIDMLGQALAAENRFTANAQLWARYESREKAMKDAVSFVSAARQEGEAIGEARGRIEGRAEGEEIGEARGLIRGEEIGDAKGSLRTALSSVRNLMSKTGWSAAESMDTLGLEADLRKELQGLLEG